MQVNQRDPILLFVQLDLDPLVRLHWKNVGWWHVGCRFGGADQRCNLAIPVIEYGDPAHGTHTLKSYAHGSTPSFLRLIK
jgi:hypothetical protein